MSIFTGSGNKVEYAGYQINILEGYNTEEKDKKLYITKDHKTYVVMIDYSHSFDKYMTYYSEDYPSFIKSCKVDLNNKQYCMLISMGYMAYLAKADSSSTFIGWVEKDNDNMYGREDLEDLSKMLSNAKYIKRNDTYNIGKDDYLELFDINNSK